MSLPSPAILRRQDILGSVSEVDFSKNVSVVQIWSDGGSADIFVSLSGKDPVVDGADTIKIAGGASWQSPPNSDLQINSLKFIGAGAGGGRLSILAI